MRNAVTAIPTAKPPMPHHGSVLNWLSSQRPIAVPPSVGTNMRQVVSAAVVNNKMTVDFSGGVGLSSLFLAAAALITVYTVTEKETQSKMPRKHVPPKHIPYRPTDNEKGKTRYPSELAAKKAAEIIMLQNPNLELRIYQNQNGGWYLTRQQSAHTND